ncbi:MAG TPA: hypothetical protein PLV58_03825 [Campylobacterales bacterium]|nr:hypothetical protein [Campylobacterales bacterium]
MVDRLKILMAEKDDDEDELELQKFKAKLLYANLHAIHESNKHKELTSSAQESFIAKQIEKFFHPETPQMAFRRCSKGGSVLKCSMLSELKRYQLKELGYTVNFINKCILTDAGLNVLHLSPELLRQKVQEEYAEHVKIKRLQIK